MKNLKIQKIQNIETINQNLNIPVGQIVLINVNKKRENVVQQEPLEQIEINDVKKDTDQLTKTKNTFTDKKLINNKLNDVRYQSNDRLIIQKVDKVDKISPTIQVNDKPIEKLLNINNVKNRPVKPNVHHTPRLIIENGKNETKIIQNNINYQQSISHSHNNKTNDHHSNPNQNNQNNQQIHNGQSNQLNGQLNNQQQDNQNNLNNNLNDAINTQDHTNVQLKQSKSNLNHHYEQPDKLLSKKPNEIRSIDTSNKNNCNNCKNNCTITTVGYDKVDGQSINSKLLTIRTTTTPHYEKPLTINKRNMNTNGSLKTNQLLDDSEINQIEFFFRSQQTFVFVSRSMANLYFTQTDLINNGRYSSPRAHEWTLSRTGVPLIIFDKGGSKCRLKRQLRFALAERGSGFQLFSDVIDNLTDYKKIHDSFHTFYLSIDHRKMGGLSFDCAKSADDFLAQIEKITSDPKNISLTGPKSLYSKKSLMNSKNQLNKYKKSIKNSIKKYKKTDISMPCLFQHVTSLDLTDFEKFYSLSTLVVKVLNPNYQKQSIDDQLTNQESDNLSTNLSKLSIENLSSNLTNLTNCNSSTKQIYLNKPYNPSSLCSYSSSSSPTLPCSSCYTSSNEDHS